MPPTRSPKKVQSTASSFSKFKQTKKTAPAKPGLVKPSGRAGIVKEAPIEAPIFISDHDSGDEEESFEPAKPGGKLDESRYKAYYRSLKRQRGIAPPIHTEGQSKVHEILRIFDCSYEYGPCIGVSRLARWERAHKAGLNPPIEVKEILMTQEGQKDDVYAQNVFHFEGV